MTDELYAIVIVRFAHIYWGLARRCAHALWSSSTSGTPTEHMWMEKRSGDLSLSVNVPSGASLVPLSLSNLNLNFISFRMYLTSTDLKLQLMNDRRRTF